MHIQQGSRQDLSRVAVKQLVATIGNFNGRNHESVNDAAYELAGRISRNQIPQADYRSLRKQLDAIPDGTINPGVDIVYSAFAEKIKLDDLQFQIKNYQPGERRRPVIAAADEIVRRSKEEPNNPDIEIVMIEIGELEQYPTNPGKEIVERYLLEKMDLNNLTAIITSPVEAGSEERVKKACEELVRRDQQNSMESKALSSAFKNVFSVADQLSIPGIEILKEHAERRSSLNNQ